jgi:hypothetical protein
MRLRIAMILLGCAAFSFAKTAQEYFRQGAYLYADAKLPSAAIEVREGLEKYPADTKLQMLLKRIEEAQEEQKNQNQKDNPQNQEQNQDQKQDQDQNKDQGSSSQQNSSGSQDPQSGNSSSSGDQGSSSSQETQATPDSAQAGDLSREQAEQLMKDFQEQDKENRRKGRFSGRAVPEKDW